MQVADVLRKEGIIVEGMVSIFNYGFDIARNAFEDSGVKLFSLTDYDTVISLAIEKNYVSNKDQNTLLNWRGDPANWGVKS